MKLFDETEVNLCVFQSKVFSDISLVRTDFFSSFIFTNNIFPIQLELNKEYKEEHLNNSVSLKASDEFEINKKIIKILNIFSL